MNYNEHEIHLEGSRGLSKYIANTFGWMFIGLALSMGVGAAIAYGVDFGSVTNEQAIFILIVALIAPVIIALMFGSSVRKLNIGMARGLFITYSLIFGITFGLIFAVYQLENIIFSFAVTSVSFGTMALLGYYTKVDLSKFGPLFLSGLISIILLTLFSALVNSEPLIIFISIFAIILFLGITAYDIQIIKKNYYACQDDPARLKAASIYSAFQLYLDFINIFIYILRIVGRFKE